MTDTLFTAKWIGWVRASGSRHWMRAVEADTPEAARQLLQELPFTWVFRDSLVLEEGKNPNERNPSC